MSAKQMELPRKFKGIWIERAIWECPKLSIIEKAFLAEIDSLDAGPDGCTASNTYLANFMGISRRQTITILKKLTAQGLIEIRTDAKNNNKTTRKVRWENVVGLVDAEVESGEITAPVGGEITAPVGGEITAPVGGEESAPVEGLAGGEADFTRVVKPASPGVVKFLTPVSGGIRKENKPNPKGLGENKSKIKEKLGIDSLAQQPLGLDLEVKKARQNFALELSDIFTLNDAEAYTFARIGQHLSDRVSKGTLPMSIFASALQWAHEARASRAASQKALFVAKIKQETGFAAQRRLIRKAAM